MAWPMIKEMIEKKTGKNVDKIIKQLEGKNKMRPRKSDQLAFLLINPLSILTQNVLRYNSCDDTII